LIAALRYDDDELQMPPDGKLPKSVIANFTKWINQGAVDPRRATLKPKTEKTIDFEAARESHWAYQTLSEPEIPSVSRQTWQTNSIDRFVGARLEAENITPAEPADPSVWLRRVYLDLIGLPPTPEQQAQFQEDTSSHKRAHLVDDLLASPHYGERWGRHWLDVARYAETKGYEQDELMPYTWLYRDWVIKAFNSDMPYDQFMLHQLAGDEIDDTDLDNRIATMFLSVGSFDTVAQVAIRSIYDQLDDIIATTSQAFMGLTLQCARCHDHKFEPVAQKDYYRMLAAFEPLDLQGLHWVALPTRPKKGFDFSTPQSREEDLKLSEQVDREVQPQVAAQEQFELAIFEELIKVKELPNGKPRLGDETLSKLMSAYRTPTDQRTEEQKKYIDKLALAVRLSFRDFLNKTQTEQYQQLINNVKDCEARRPLPRMLWVFSENGPPQQTHVRVRGETLKLGDPVEFSLPSVLNWGELPLPTKTDRETSGRRTWLAKWLAGPGKGLAARVMVNRVWQYHFGKGFVDNANNLGLSGGKPSHPGLLNWLAHDFVQGGWKLKPLHRKIVLSQTYGQSVSNPGATADRQNMFFSHWPQYRLEAEIIRDSMLSVSGKLNMKMHGASVYPKIHGAVINGAGSALKNRNWGRSNDRDASRRSIYVFAKRAFQLPELRSLGQPDSGCSCEKRMVATTSIQSLLLMNGEFAWQQAQYFAARVRAEVDTTDQRAVVNRAYELTLGREPDVSELELSLEFLTAPALTGEKIDRLESFCQVLFNTSEFAYQN